jgi:hypothetical protein
VSDRYQRKSNSVIPIGRLLYLNIINIEKVPEIVKEKTPSTLYIIRKKILKEPTPASP